jgi:hypothetical protein
MSYTIYMTEDKKQVQKTTKGYEIPIPTKEEFERNLKKASKPDKPDKSVPQSPEE